MYNTKNDRSVFRVVNSRFVRMELFGAVHSRGNRGDKLDIARSNVSSFCSLQGLQWVGRGLVRTRRCRKVECREVPPGGKMATSLLLLVRAHVRPGTRSDECCAASSAGESTLHFFAGLA